jgi:hypothetical protein
MPGAARLPNNLDLAENQPVRQRTKGAFQNATKKQATNSLRFLGDWTPEETTPNTIILERGMNQIKWPRPCFWQRRGRETIES